MTTELKLGDRVAGRYEIRSTVGKGPFGVVYAAHDTEIEVTVALKVFSASFFPDAGARRRACDALRAARKISHRNLNRVFDVGDDSDRVYYAAQLIEGLPLDRALAMRRGQGDRFSSRESEALISQLCDALSLVHLTTFHGNLKPTNVLILPDAIKVTDLAVREALDVERFSAALGSYHAPELREHRGDVRSDLYSIGVIAFELLVGPWDDACARGEAAERAKALGASEPIVRFLARAIAVNPADRFVSTGELLTAFREAVGLVAASDVSSGGMPAKLVVPNTAEHVAADASTARQPSLEFPDDKDESHAPSRDEVLASAPTPPPLPGRAAAGPPRRRPERSSPPTIDPGTIPDAKIPPRPPARAATPAGGTTPTPPVGESVQPPGHRALPSGFALRWALLAAAFAIGTAGSLVAIDQIDREIARLRSQPVHDPSDGKAKSNQGGTEARRSEELKDAGKERVGAEIHGTAKGDAGAVATAASARRDDETRRRRESREAHAARESAPDRETKPPKGKCAKGMVLVKGGKTPVGSAANDPLRAFGDRAFEWVKVDDFCVDVYEYPGYRGALPATRVSFGDAQASCEREGKRLCSEDEWERACNGGKKNRYPYGDDFDADRCNSADATGAPRKVAVTGAFKGCRASSGAADMSGNVAEWAAAAPSLGSKLGSVRGGSSLRPDYGVRCASRLRKPAGERSGEIGFRCCATP